MEGEGRDGTGRGELGGRGEGRLSGGLKSEKGEERRETA